jgi:hypothetical protein
MELAWGVRCVKPGAMLLSAIVAWLAIGSLSVPVAAACSNESLRTGASARLPDCRAYGQVTPREKGAGEDIRGKAIPAEDGSAVALYTIPRLGPRPQRTGSFLVFRRSSEGWTPIPVTPPGLGDASATQDPLFDANLSTVAFGVLSEGLKGFESTVQPVLTGPVGGPYRQVAEIPIDRLSTEAFEKSKFVKFAGSANLGRIALQSADHELLGTPTGTDQGAYDLYGYSEGRLSQINVTSAGTTIGTCGATLGYGTDPEHKATHHVVSDDGSRVFFTAPDPRPISSLEPGCESPSRLYMRVGDSETVEVSAPEPGVVPPSQFPAFFAGASADGRYVLFSTQTALTADAEGLVDNELYLYDAQTRRLTRISHGESGAAAGELNGPGALLGREYGVAISDDGSTVYFVANGALTANAPVAGNKLYRYDVADDATRYIATITPNSSGFEPLFPTPNGHFLDFTANSVEGPSIESHTGVDQVYRYSVTSNQVVCASCPRGGAPGGGTASQPVVEAASGSVLVPSDITPMPQVISNDGRYVFFNTTDHLAPEDTSRLATGSPEQVIGEAYEWVAQETDGCTDPEGCQRLLSSGTESHVGSPLLGGSADGSSVFFLTHSQLLPSDTDERNDIYDAQIGGGFPESAPVTPCSGEICQGEPTKSPSFAEPGSQSFVGSGNLHPRARCGRLAHQARRIARRARATRGARLEQRARALRARSRHCKRAKRRRSK